MWPPTDNSFTFPESHCYLVETSLVDVPEGQDAVLSFHQSQGTKRNCLRVSVLSLRRYVFLVDKYKEIESHHLDSLDPVEPGHQSHELR